MLNWRKKNTCSWQVLYWGDKEKMTLFFYNFKILVSFGGFYV